MEILRSIEKWGKKALNKMLKERAPSPPAALPVMPKLKNYLGRTPNSSVSRTQNMLQVYNISLGAIIAILKINLEPRLSQLWFP